MFCPWCGGKNCNEAVYCETCGRHLQTGTRPAAHLSTPPKVAQAKQRHLPWWSWVVGGVVLTGLVILGIVLLSIRGEQVPLTPHITVTQKQGDGVEQVTLTQHITVTQPDAVSRHYLSSADLRSYTRGQDRADVVVMDAMSPSALEDWLRQTATMLEIQGFKRVDDRIDAQVYERTWDPVLCQTTEEYVEILVVGYKIIMARGTNLDLVDELLREAAK